MVCIDQTGTFLPIQSMVCGGSRTGAMVDDG